MKTRVPLFALILFTSFVNAQTADLSLENVHCQKTLMTSSPGMYMYSLEFDYTIKNNGPDSITPNDTIYVYWRQDWATYASFARLKHSNHTLAPGDTIMRKKDQVLLSVPDQGMVMNSKFYMKVNVSRDGVNRDDNPANDELMESSSTGIEDLDLQQFVPVYPNPTATTITLDDQLKEATIELFDLTGRRVMCEHTQSNHTLSVSQLPPGIYAYRISTVNNQVISGKLIRQE